MLFDTSCAMQRAQQSFFRKLENRTSATMNRNSGRRRPTMKKSVCIALLMMLFLMLMPAASQAIVFYNPGTNHWYELVDATPTQEYWEATGHTDGAQHYRIWSLAQQRAVVNRVEPG